MSALPAGAALGIGLAAVLVACGDTGSGARTDDTTAALESVAALSADTTQWRVRLLEGAPPRFRPGGWSSEDVLWGLVGGRLTRLDTRTGETRTLPHEAWSIHAAAGVVAWDGDARLRH